MDVILLRHGIAEPHGSRADDDARELTDEGRRKMKEIAPALAEIFPKAEAIYSSPLPRAMQTAEFVAKAYKLRVKKLDILRPGSDPGALREFLDAASEKNLICVGHEPHLSTAMLALTRMHGSIELKKGGCYRVRWAGGAGRLEWMLPPRALRRSR